jgi:hypothetical protein
LKVSISSKKTKTKTRMKSCSTSFIRAWNVVGALVKPNSITKNSKCPWWVRLLDVPNIHSHLVIPATQIQFSEEACGAQFIKDLLDHRNWKHVAYCLGVQCAIVHTEALCPVLFLDKQYWRRESRQTRPDDSLLQHLDTLSLQFILHQLWVSIRPHYNWRCPRQEVNPVVMAAWQKQSCRNAEDVDVVVQEYLHEARGQRGMDSRHVAAS